MTGRPTKCTSEITGAFCAAVRRGATRTLAAQASGIGTTTLYRWLDAAEQDGPEFECYRAFRAALDEAESALLIELSGVVLDAAKTDPKYALLYLERRVPEDWSPTRKFQHSGEGGGPIQFGVVLMPPEGEGDDAPDAEP